MKTLRRFGSSISDLTLSVPPDFDPSFYRDAYPDLTKIGSKRLLLRHYLQHGKAEGRFANLVAAREFFGRSGKTIPDDFVVGDYIRLNPDLRRLYRTPLQFELHFLRHGLDEGRIYKREDGTVGPLEAWQTEFNLHEFVLMSESWRTRDIDCLETAFSVFAQDGVPMLAPLAKELVFDPDFYRDQYGIDISDTVALYRHWLYDGLPKGLAPNVDAAVVDLVGDLGYPRAFDWQGFVGNRKSRGSQHPAKLDALRELFDRPFSSHARQCIAGPGSMRLLSAMGDRHMACGSSTDAAQCFQSALKHAAPSERPGLLCKLGDALSGLQKRNAALECYDEARGHGGAPLAAVTRAAILRSHAGSHREALSILAERKRIGRYSKIFSSACEDCIEALFSDISGGIQTMIEAGEIAKANVYGETELTELAGWIQTLMVSVGGVSLIADETRMVMLACLDLPQCTRYRVDQKVEQLARLGVVLEVFDFNQPDAFLKALPGASSAIFYRVPGYPRIVEAILVARALGIPTYYDMDDLVFTTEFPHSLESYGGLISREDHVGLQHGVPLYRHAISLCDFGLASTRSLADALASLVRTGQAFVVPNGLDSWSVVSTSREQRRRLPDVVTVFYGSGTKAHNSDFESQLAGPLLRLCEEFESVQLVIAGFLYLDERFDRIRHRIRRFSFIHDHEQYVALLAHCDINVAVLSPSPLADCKSEIKWLEAAVLEIPSVLSATATYAQVVRSPDEGLICGTQDEWFDALAALVRDPSLRDSVGRSARMAAVTRYSSEVLGRNLVGVLRSRKAPAPIETKVRVLICNVFFASQSAGGATRVVEANVDYLVKHFGDTIEVAIFATAEGMPEEHFSIEKAHGCLVFRVGTRIRRNEDWQPTNDKNREPFRRACHAFRPDLIHFHCIQKLTASIVEEARDLEIPYIVTVHDAWWISDHQFMVDEADMPVPADSDAFVVTLPIGITRLQSLRRAFVLRAHLHAAQSVLAVSRSFAETYIAAGCTDVRVIANGLSTLPAPLPPTRQDGKLVIGHLGGRSAHKGASLLEIVLKNNAFANLRLVMIDASSIENASLRWGATDVDLIGSVPLDRINELFARIDVLVAPSIWPESYGLLCREALVYGKWVIASSLGAMSEDVDVGVNGYRIDPRSTSDIKRVLAMMNGNVEYYKIVPSGHLTQRSADEQAVELAALYASYRRKGV